MPFLAQAEFICFRYPLPSPLETVLGRVESRPALIVRIEDTEGAVGFGEIWCNFPVPGAEYRARLAASIAKGALANRDSDQPHNAFSTIRSRLNPLVLQAGEPGPVDQIASGLDIALHDLAARRKNLSLAALLGGAPRPMSAYASGIGPPNCEELLSQSLASGFESVKLRIGFGSEADLAMIASARRTIGDERLLMVDVNQQWSLDAALTSVKTLEPFAIGWLEEPLAADRPDTEWAKLAAATSIPIAAGENLRGWQAFDTAIANGNLQIVQPDVCKWGGLSECISLAKAIRAAGLRYCPHYLGGGVGLAASAHLLAAAGGDGLLEVDLNDNPLREVLAAPLFPLTDGDIHLPDGAGLGFVPDLAAISGFMVERHQVRLVS